MKNITITVHEDVAKWARIYAAKHETSVSRIVGEMLRNRMEEEEGYEAAKNAFLARPSRSLRARAQSFPTREEIHER